MACLCACEPHMGIVCRHLKRGPHPTQLELQMVLNHQVGPRSGDEGPLQEHQVLLIAELFLKPYMIFKV